ncbi:hypothetical protein ACH44C_10985 [Streptomyces purpureus]|uniref:hypothetical protein n=1 Tax=Streptomyces purpureus TaxID=1951 RepID=UPI0037BA76B5
MKRTTLPRMTASATFGREPYVVAAAGALDAMPAQPARRSEPVDHPRAEGKLIARIEQADLPEGVPLIISKAGDRMAYNPSAINALDARLAYNIYVDFTEGQQIDGLRELGWNAKDATSRELYATVLDKIDRSGDAPGVIARVVELFGQARAEADAADARCPRYRWCTETGKHAEHTGETITATCQDAYGDPVLHATLMHWDDKGVRVGLLEHDLTPDEARTTLAELRAHLDAVEKLIDAAEAGE